MRDIKSSNSPARPGKGAWPPRSISGGGTAARSTWAEIPSSDGAPAAWCYTDQRSYRSGETAHLFISGTVSSVDLRIYKDGDAPSDKTSWTNVAILFQPVPESSFSTGMGWQKTVSIDLAGYEPGAYIVELREAGASCKNSALAHHIFFVRATVADPAALLLIAATSTWTAYNDFGGASHYRGFNPDYPLGASPKLSTERPWARGQVWLPDGAPRVAVPLRSSKPTPPRYEWLDWAYANGYTRYYASAGWPSYELPFLKWAERAGYSVHVIAQDDLELHPDCLDGYKCAVLVGHDEYWSMPMRDAIDEFVDGGGRVARFAGNFTWQIRLENEGRDQVCFKSTAPDLDPLRDTNPELLTGAWEDPRINHPGASTFGVNGLRGVYAGFGGMAPRSPGGFNVFRPEHWSLKGTGLVYADMFGDEAGIFGFEVDGLEYTFKDGLPVPTQADGAPQGLEIIAMGWATLSEGGLPEHAYAQFLGDADARYAASILDGRTDDEAVGKRSRGCGVVVSFRRGAGEVFCAGSCEWVRGLMNEEFYTGRITRNVLDRFLEGAEA
ncbi:N,N-dimethylformamidase beta subunit family domain-containing protein [Aminobacter aminovorans]|uniref:N,N-dimethylformamidase beta subunit-like C-terminal domain-containing protein n=1 Tax=Aminobacter aminovorans TaxID=83263 RepID=A0AAC8YWS8_AMIAI|nr:N,N-dimethylformamidase beta subunit family domain-containing protein [Aminobacter aminovorans]AMS45456.1 hypothetical protein AA2016_6566 [Aminobacter aminovorans]MBB3708663.1 hypothetical protein [Aminobacter aminovorans]